MRKTLEGVSDAELEAELEERRKKLNTPPTPLPSPDFTHLMFVVVNGIQSTVDNGHQPKDFDNTVYETAIEAIYGKDFWKWYNKQNFDS